MFAGSRIPKFTSSTVFICDIVSCAFSIRVKKSRQTSISLLKAIERNGDAVGQPLWLLDRPMFNFALLNLKM